MLQQPRRAVLGLPEAARAAQRRRSTRASDRRLPGSVGIPVPENYSAPSYTGLEEDLNVHLQAFRLGDILFTVCSCEQWVDQSAQHQDAHRQGARATSIGYDWARRCTDNGDGTWACPNPGNPLEHLPPITAMPTSSGCARRSTTRQRLERPENLLRAESEPTDPAQIKGNYTHDETATAELGYRPDGPDRDGQRLQRLHRQLPRVPARRPLPQGAHRLGPALQRLHGHAPGRAWAATSTAARDLPPETRSRRRSRADVAAQRPARGRARRDRRDQRDRAYEAALPDDGGTAGRPVSQPQDIERFDAAFFTWNGGSNFTDSPRGAGAAPERRRLGRLRRPVRRGPDHARVPAGRRTCRATAGGQRVAVDRALRGLRLPLRQRRGTCAPRRRAPTASWSTGCAGRRRRGGALPR